MEKADIHNYERRLKRTLLKINTAKEFSHYCDWGKIGEEVIKKAQEVFVNL